MLCSIELDGFVPFGIGILELRDKALLGKLFIGMLMP